MNNVSVNQNKSSELLALEKANDGMSYNSRAFNNIAYLRLLSYLDIVALIFLLYPVFFSTWYRKKRPVNGLQIVEKVLKHPSFL